MPRRAKNDQPAPIPSEHIYRTCQVAAVVYQDGYDGQAKVGLRIAIPGEIMVFPMPPEYAERKAGEMTAAAIEIQSAPTQEP